MSDGWSDMKNKSLINILVNNPYDTIFLRSVDAFDRVSYVDYIFSILDETIEEIWEKIMVQIITDNASAYKTAGAQLIEKRRHLYCTPCATHYLDLILKRLGDLPQPRSALSRAKKLASSSTTTVRFLL